MQVGSRVNPPEEYTRDILSLNGGLDLLSPKINAAKGSLLSCLNREIVDRIGYKTIDGFEPYNGRSNVFNDDYYYVDSTAFTPPLAATFSEGMALAVEGKEKVFGVVVELETIAGSPTTYRIYFALVNQDAAPRFGDVVVPFGLTSTFSVSSSGIQSCAETLGESAEETVVRFNGYSSTLRNFAETYPGNAGTEVPPHGLHWFRDRLYAVANDGWFYFDSGGTTELLVNQFIGTTNDRSRVISVQLQSGTWAGGDAKGIIQIDSEVPLAWTNNTNLNTYTALSAGSVITNNILTTAASTDFDPVPNPLHASLWESLSLQQAFDDDGDINSWGWRRIDHGWSTTFDEGFSDTGGFTTASRGSENNFTFVESNEETFPFTIFNGSNLVGVAFAPQRSFVSTGQLVENGFPGWKTNASSTVFASQDALVTATESTDSNYAYANIWYNGTGDVTAANGIATGRLGAFDGNVYGPVDTFLGRSAPTVTGATFDSDFFTTQARSPLVLNDFSEAASLLPEGALIQGVEVTVDYSSQHYAEGQFAADRNGTNGANIVANTILWVKDSISWAAQFVESSSTTQAQAIGTTNYSKLELEETPGSYNIDITSSADTDVFALEATLGSQSTVIGSSTSTLGVENLTRTRLFDPTLGIALFGQVTASPLYPLSPTALTTVTPSGYEFVLGVIRVKVDRIKVTFHYTVPSARYFVGDGAGPPANVCTVDLIYFVRSDGSFSSRTAEGSIQFTNLVPDVTGTKRTISVGDKFYSTQTDAENDTNPVLQVASKVDYNGVPSLEKIIENTSRFNFITANFYGREDWDGFYGVSGAGTAFSFATYNADNSVDGSLEKYIINITTNTEDQEGDIPRHIAFHHNALALGYSSGIVRFSVPGEPENFDGVQGAAEIGIGDEVTGLLSLRGTTLGVYCANSIWGIQGTDADNYQTQVLSPSIGAIEHTVLDIGLPIHCDTRGISTLEQSEKYGDFLGQRLSQSVTPFVSPRMISDSSQFTGEGVLGAIPVRSKNQYRAFFKDGKVLVMTFDQNQAPSFTMSEYFVNNVESNKVLPIAWSSQVDDTGVERIHFSNYSLDYSSPYVYELDRGWGFEGNPIPNNYVVNWIYNDPFSFYTVKKVRLDGLTKGLSSCNVSTASDYNLDFGTAVVDISIPRSSASNVYTKDFQPATNMSNIAKRGRNITLKVEYSPLDGVGPTPPDIHQVMLLQYDPGGRSDA